MAKSALNAFTLVELLVVIAIIAVIGTITLANFRPFGEDQELKNAILNIQSLLIQTQTSASSNAICSQKSGAAWQAELFSNKELRIICKDPRGAEITKKSIKLSSSVEIQTPVMGVGPDCPNNFPVRIDFTLLSGNASFISPSGIISPNCTSLDITLKKTTPPEKTKILTIDRGGKINAK